MATTSPAGACPICGQALDVDRPDLPVLDATCTSCGWHTSSASARRQGSPQGGSYDTEDAGEEEGRVVYVDLDPVTFLRHSLAVGMPSDEIVAAYRRTLDAIPDEDAVDAPEA